MISRKFTYKNTRKFKKIFTFSSFKNKTFCEKARNKENRFPCRENIAFSTDVPIPNENFSQPANNLLSLNLHTSTRV